MSSTPKLQIYRGRWYAVWAENGSTKRVAMRASADERDKASRNFHDWLRTPQGETVGDIMEAYLADRDINASHPERLRLAWARAKSSFQHLRPDQITRQVCRDYTKYRADNGVMASTARKELETVRAGLRWARKSAESVFEFPPKAPPKDRSLSKAEFKRLLDGCVQPHIRLFCLLGLHTGARATAILELTWDRVDFKARRVDYTDPADRKRRKRRASVPMSSTLYEALVEAKQAAQTDWVIEYAQDRVRSVKRGFAAACRRAGLKGVTPHVLRHTCAVWLAEAGRPMSEISQYLGHSSSRVTEEVYARYSPGHMRQSAETFDE